MHTTVLPPTSGLTLTRALPLNNADILRGFIECCNRHRFDALGEFVAFDVRVNGQETGLAHLREALSRLAATFPDYHWRVESLIAAADMVAARFTTTGTRNGGDGPGEDSINTFELATYRFDSGKIVEIWTAADGLPALIPSDGSIVP